MNRNTYIFNFNRLLWILATGITLNVGYISYLAFWPVKTIDFHQQRLQVNNSPKPGEPLNYTIDYCKYTDVTPTFTRVLVGNTIVGLADSSLILNNGCDEVQLINTVIPSYTIPGRYYMKLNICFQVNPLNNICQDISTESFEVK